MRCKTKREEDSRFDRPEVFRGSPPGIVARGKGESARARPAPVLLRRCKLHCPVTELGLEDK